MIGSAFLLYPSTGQKSSHQVDFILWTIYFLSSKMDLAKLSWK